MCGNADGADARPAAAVWNAKGLVQIQVAHVRADIARATEAYLRVHVGAVHVNLAAAVVHDFANFADRCFENTVRTRVCDHQRRQIMRMSLGFCAEICEVDVTVFERCDGNYFEPGHDGAGGISSVSGLRNEADVTMRFATRGVIFPNREQTSEFSLRSGVWLKRHRGETANFREPAFELIAHFAIACRL